VDCPDCIADSPAFAIVKLAIREIGGGAELTFLDAEVV
jgi:hypothetical protein